MKIIASRYPRDTGWRLGIMVGCLTLGTAFPYGIDALGLDLDWRGLAALASVAALGGGALVLLGVQGGPATRDRARLDLRMIVRVFRHAPFRNTAFGYFGHMWELYALWAFVGFYVAHSVGGDPTWSARLPLLAFGTVAMGAVGCVVGGLVSRRTSERAVAIVSMLVSMSMCLLSGVLFDLPPSWLFAFLLVWGFFVVSDSPQLSALAARNAPPGYTATALTIQNGIGFLVTTVSIQLVPLLAARVGWQWAFAGLAIGPAIGALFTYQLPAREPSRA